MDRLPHRARRTVGGGAGALLVGFLCAAVPVVAPSDPGPGVSPGRSSGATVEPSPPLSLNIRSLDLQTTRGGAIAALVVEVFSAVPVERLSLEVTLPGQAIFTDGSGRKIWPLEPAPGRLTRIPIGLLIQGRGRLFIAAELTGTIGDRPVRRGTAYELRVGPEPERSRVRDGAIEFRGGTASRRVKR